jgi:hypothetical protein
MSAGLQAFLTVLNLVSIFVNFFKKTHGTVPCIRPKLPPSKSLSARLCDYIPICVNATPIVCKLIKSLSLRDLQYSLQSTDWRCVAAHARRTQNPTTVSCHLWCGVKCVALTMSLTAAYGNWCAWSSDSANVSRLPFVQRFMRECLCLFQKTRTKVALNHHSGDFQHTVKYTIDAS